jgi:acyl dehydratase
MTCKVLVDNLLDGDVGALKSYGARMAGVVFPGETLRVSVWKNSDHEGAGYSAVVTAPGRDDAVALAGVEFVPA